MLTTILSLQAHSFTANASGFFLDDQPFQIRAGEIHPTRIPVENWEHSIALIKNMGLNTLSVYFIWNEHEQKDLSFDFSSTNHNITYFLELAKKYNMYVLHRPGPYICGEIDFGGLPYYLMNTSTIRSSDPVFMANSKRWLKAIDAIIKPYLITENGTVIMTQLENEYGSYSNTQDSDYVLQLQQIHEDAGLNVPFYACDGPWSISSATPKGTVIGLNGQLDANAIAQAKYHDSSVPSLNAEIYPGWYNYWGSGHDWYATNISSYLEYYMSINYSFSIYMVQGGTSFGVQAGNNQGDYNQDTMLLDLTSYDYGSPITECGNVTDAYYAYQKLIGGYVEIEEVDVPEIKFGQVESIKLERVASIYDQVTNTVISETPLTLEYMEMNQGFVVYETTLPQLKQGTLYLQHVNDWARVFIDGKEIHEHNRIHSGKFNITISQSDITEGKLKLFVEGTSHFNYANVMATDFKGIFGTVQYTVDGQSYDLTNWQMKLIPVKSLEVKENDNAELDGTGVFVGKFDMTIVGDIYIHMDSYGKGFVYVNGHNLGRYWTSEGAQYALYCPMMYLKEKDNEIVVTDVKQDIAHDLYACETLSQCQFEDVSSAQMYISPRPQTQTIKQNYFALSQFEVDCQTSSGKDCIDQVQDVLDAFQPMFYPRDQPHNASEYQDLQISNVISKLSITLENTYDQMNIQTTNESYTLDVSQNGIQITAENRIGAVHALASLAQLIDIYPGHTQDHAAYAIYQTTVEDEPSMKWRELMLDPARHYLPVESIKKQILGMAVTKFNVLRLHIADSESFPLEFQKGKAAELVQGAYSQNYIYQLQDIQEIIDYAYNFGIYVYLEIPIFEHVQSWNASNPDFVSQCPATAQSNLYQVLINPLNDDVYTTIQEIIQEIHDLDWKYTPMIHLSGEAPQYDCFNEDQTISQYMSDNSISGNDLWSLFNQKVADIINGKFQDMIVVRYEDIYNNGQPVGDNTVYNVWYNTNINNFGDNKLIWSSELFLDKQYPNFAQTYHYLWQDTIFDFFQSSFGISGQISDNYLGGAMLMWGKYYWSDAVDGQIWPRAIGGVERMWNYKQSTAGGTLQYNQMESGMCKLYQQGLYVGPMNTDWPCIGYTEH